MITCEEVEPQVLRLEATFSCMSFIIDAQDAYKDLCKRVVAHIRDMSKQYRTLRTCGLEILLLCTMLSFVVTDY